MVALTRRVTMLAGINQRVFSCVVQRLFVAANIAVKLKTQPCSVGEAPECVTIYGTPCP